MRTLLLLFIAIPFLELYLLLKVGSLIGFWPTVAIAIGTGILGAALAKREGYRVWRQWHKSLETMQPPPQGVVDGILVFVAGALLISPGMLTDVAGLLLLVPAVRRPVVRTLRRAVDRRIAAGQIRIVSDFGSPSASPFRPRPAIETTGESVGD